MPYSMARRLMTGSVPGRPSETASTALLGAASTLSTTGQSLNILLAVCSSACTSRPMTGIHSVMARQCTTGFA